MTGSPGSRVYRVIGLLTTTNELQVPGHRFRLSDSAAIGEWLTKLADDGPTAPGAADVPFGLRREQYVALRRSFGQPVEVTTAGVSPGEVAGLLTGAPLLLVLAGGTLPRFFAARKARSLSIKPTS